MFSNGPIEYAMTHVVGSGGRAERCLRPDSIQEIVKRMHQWNVVAEPCKSCLSLPSVRMTDGMGLCSRCHAQRFQRMPVDKAGMKPVAVHRADEAEAMDKRLQGYAIRFNDRSVDLGGFYEYVRPAAADRMVAEKPDIRGLWSHDMSEPLARTSAGTLRYAKRTSGVWVEYDPPRGSMRRVESIERRDVTGQSFGFRVLSDDWWLDEGIPNREVLDMDVIEVSPVAFPAYPTTSIKAVRSDVRSEWQIEQETADRLRRAAI